MKWYEAMDGLDGPEQVAVPLTEREAMKRDIELAKKVQKTIERHKDVNSGHLPDDRKGQLV